MLKLLVPLFLLSCGGSSPYRLKQSDTYVVFDRTARKDNSWFMDGDTLYKENTPFLPKYHEVNYKAITDSSLMEKSFTSGYNTLKTSVDLAIFKKGDYAESNMLAEFIDSCAEEYDLNALLSVKVRKGSEEQITRLAEFSKPYPNILGVELTYEPPETQDDIQAATVSILKINPDIMIVSAYPLDIPKSKLIRE